MSLRTILQQVALAATISGCLVLLVTNVKAGDATWNQATTGAGGVPWDDVNNWSPNTTYPNGIGETAYLTLNAPNSPAAVITIPSTSITVGTINMGAPTGNRGYTVNAASGGSLILDATGSSDAVINYSAGSSDTRAVGLINAPITLNDNLDVSNTSTASITVSNLTLAGPISGPGKSIIVGDGSSTRAVTLSGANTFDGGVTLKSGILQLGNPAGLGTGPLTLNGGELRSTSNANGTFTNNVMVTADSAVTPMTIANGSAGLFLNGTLSSSGAAGAGPVLTVGQAMSGPRVVGFAGDLSGFTGTIKTIQNPIAAGGFGTRIDLGNAAPLIVDGSHANFVIDSFTGSPIGTPDGVTMRIGYNDGGTTKMGSLSGAGRFGVVGFAANYTLEVGALGTVVPDTTFSGDIISQGAAVANGTHLMDFKKVGAGSLALSGNNSYVGDTTISNGTLVAGIDALVSKANISGTTGTMSISGNTFTSALPHGLSNGDRVFIEAGLATADVATLALKPMFVVGAAGNTFQLEASPGGGAQAFTNAASVAVAMPTAFGAGTTPIALGDGGASTNNVKLLAGTASNPTVTIARAITVANNAGGNSTIGSEVDGNSIFSGAITLNKNLNLTSASTPGANAVTVSGVISSSGAFGVTKVGSGEAVFSGANTYSGDTIVSQGILSITNSFLADAAAVRLDTANGVLDLGFSGTDSISALYFNNVAQSAGTYGGTGSGATNIFSWFTGSGTLTVGPTALPGDFNHNGSVDAADYVVWRKTLGDSTNYNLWRSNFGNHAGSGSSLSGNSPAVPEPASVLLILAGVVGAALRRTRR